MRDPLTPPSGYLDHAAARRIVVGVLLTMLLAALDQVMVATALPTIAASLGDVDNMSWVVTANLLCATAATPLYGKLSDIHGRRAMMLIAIGIYAAGSLACALAPSMLTLILGRALQMRLLKSQRYDPQLQKWAGGDADRKRAVEAFRKYLDIGGPYTSQARDALVTLGWK